MTKLSVEYKNQTLGLTWVNEKLLETLLKKQRHLSTNTINDFYQTKFEWFDKIGLYNDLPDSPNILDIGSGIGINNLLMSQIIKSGKFYLLDKDEIKFGEKEYFGATGVHGFYNNKACTLDAIVNSNLSTGNFVFLNTEDEWNVQFDLITSFASWCWHYTLEAYWDRVCKSLKPNGKLYLEVSTHALLDDPNLIDKISKFTNCEPTVYPCNNRHATDENLIWIDGCYGYSCIWKNNLGV